MNEWEAQLRAEGHAADYALRADATKLPGLPITDAEIVAGKTSGHARRLVNGEAEIERRASILHMHHFRSSQDRQIWELYAEGYGTREISTRLDVSRWSAMQTIGRIEKVVTTRNSRKCSLINLVRQSDPQLLIQLAQALLSARR